MHQPGFVVSLNTVMCRIPIAKLIPLPPLKAVVFCRSPLPTSDQPYGAWRWIAPFLQSPPLLFASRAAPDGTYPVHLGSVLLVRQTQGFRYSLYPTRTYLFVLCVCRPLLDIPLRVESRRATVAALHVFPKSHHRPALPAVNHGLPCRHGDLHSAKRMRTK